MQALTRLLARKGIDLDSLSEQEINRHLPEIVQIVTDEVLATQVVGNEITALCLRLREECPNV